MTRPKPWLAACFALAALAPLRAAPPTTVLAVLAHPDDEVHMAGTLCRLVQAGHQVQAVYVTSGNAGQDRSGRGLSGPELAAVREREAGASNQILGFSRPPHFLRFADGEVFGKLREVVGALAAVAREVRPTLVMTFGPNGVTGHPDHMGVHLAVRNLRDRVAAPPEWLAVVFSDERAARFDPKWGMLGVKPHAIDVRVPISPAQARRRLMVLKAHRTQFRPEMIEDYRARTLAGDLEEQFQGATTVAGIGQDG